MANDLLDGMDDMFADSAAVTQPEPVQPTEPVQAPAPAPTSLEQPRAADGKFAPKEQAQPTAMPVTPAPVVDKPLTADEVSAIVQMRLKTSAAEDRAKKAEAELAQARQQQNQIPADLDPASITQYLQRERNDAVFTFSERVARKDYGDATVQAAMDWGLQRAQQNPAFQAEYLKQEHPIEWAVKQHKRELILAQIGDDPDAFIEARIAARLGQVAAPQTQAAQPSQAASPQLASQVTPQAPPPPRSIATATAAGGGANLVPPAGEFAMVDERFNR